jgi:hypothetical protein
MLAQQGFFPFVGSLQRASSPQFCTPDTAVLHMLPPISFVSVRTIKGRSIVLAEIGIVGSSQGRARGPAVLVFLHVLAHGDIHDAKNGIQLQKYTK